MRNQFFPLSLIVMLMACFTAGQAKHLYVDASAAPGGDGQAWDTAFRFLQDAIADAGTNDTIWVAGGTYRPDRSEADPNGTFVQTACFVLKSGLKLLGGFAGTEDPQVFDPLDRDPALHPTILTGDLLGNDDTAVTGADLLNDPNRSENAYHVLKGTGIPDTAMIDGFTITGGHALDTVGDDALGGGLFNTNNSNPQIRNCCFIRNVAERGGAIAGYRSGNSIENTQFINNASTITGGSLHISGLLADMVVTDCQFLDCFSEGWGGAVHLRNAAVDGGRLILEHCLLAGNRVWKLGNTRGGAIDNYNSELQINHCTLADNVSDNEGGAVRSENGTVGVTHSIVWNNEDASGLTETAQLHVINSTLTVSYCCVTGWTGAFGGAGNFNADPLFVNPGAGNYHLQSQAGHYLTAARWTADAATSPCIDAGNPNAPIGFEIQPNGAVRNIGVYGGTVQASKTWFPTACDEPAVADINGDCLVNLLDLSLLAGNWLN